MRVIPLCVAATLTAVALLASRDAGPPVLPALAQSAPYAPARWDAFARLRVLALEPMRGPGGSRTLIAPRPRVAAAPQAPTRTLLFTPEDAARLRFFHPLVTPEVRLRVKTLPLRLGREVPATPAR
jgi:hypothetical protein